MCLAIVQSIIFLHPHIEGERLSIRTDKNSLLWILNLADAAGRLAQCELHFSEFDIDVVHCAGIKHEVADVLSQLLTEGTVNKPLKAKLPVLVIVSGKTWMPQLPPFLH